MPHLHRLKSKDLETMTGVCASCGPVALARRSGGVACAVARRGDPTRAAANRAAVRERYPERGAHGLTADEARQAVEGKACEICGGKDRLYVDHCHTHGHRRGVLCSNCNTVLGLMADSPDRLRAAADYLTRTGTPQPV